MSTPPIPHFDVKNLNIVPTFDGTPSELSQFLTVSAVLLNHYYNQQDAGCIQNKLLLHGLLGKLIGRAKEVVSVHGYDTWEDVKNTLIQHFGDQRNENSLTRDLVNLRQHPNEAPLHFYEKCMNILSTITNYIDLHTPDEPIRRSKKEFFQQQTLTTFLAGLREPLGSTIRAMRPQTLAKAMQYIQEENNIRYLQGNSHNLPTTSKKQNPSHAHAFQQRPPQQSHHQQSWNSMRPTTGPYPNQFPQGPVQVTPRQNQPQQRFFSNKQVFGAQQNVWKPKTNGPGPSQQPKTMPMSTSTRNSGPPTQMRKTTTNFFKQNPQQRPTFVSEELFNIEQDNTPYENQPYNNYYEEYSNADCDLTEETEEYEFATEEQSVNFQNADNTNSET